MKGALLVLVLVSTLAMFPTSVQSLPHKRGPVMDFLHIITYGSQAAEFAALAACTIDITDWPVDATTLITWIKTGLVPATISLGPYTAIDAFEYDINNQKWPTGCDGVAAREGYTGTFNSSDNSLFNDTRGLVWNQFHTRQRPDTSVGMEPPAYNPATQTIPMGNGSDYDPETDSWKTYIDDDCLWCTMAWGLRLALAYKTDKDYIVATCVQGLGNKMITKAAAPVHHGWLDIVNLTDSSFWYHGPHGDVFIPSLIMDQNLTKADELLDAAGFIDWDGDGTRNDPRKVAGPDKQYGTGDDDITAASNMDSLKFYIQLDDPIRVCAGQKLAGDLIANGVPVNEIVVHREVCFKSVKLQYDYHLYTAGWVLSPDIDYLHHLFHSSMYWYPLGYSPNYPGFAHKLTDYYLEWVKNGATFKGPGGIFPGFRNATFLINKYVASIPLWSTMSAKAYKTGWNGTVNMVGEGKDNYWSFFNMRWAGPGPPTTTINWGFCNTPESLNVITAEWKWDRKILGLIYESLIVRNPYNLARARERSMLAETWSTGTWDGDKVYVDFTLKDNVTWHDGTKLTAQDVKWGLEFIRDCGFGVAWTHPVENGGTYLETTNLRDLLNVTVLTPGQGGSVRAYFNSSSYWALHWAGFPLLPSRKIWMNASAFYGWGYNPANPPGVGAGKRWPSDAQRMMVRAYEPWKHDVYDPNDANPGPDGIPDLTQDGTGPWVFVGVTGMWAFIDLAAFRSHHLFQDEVELYIEGAFNDAGNVNYLGSTYTYPTTDRRVDEFDMIKLDVAMFTNSTHYPHGSGQGQYNVDCDFNSDNKVSGVDYAIAGFYYGMSGGC